MALHSVAVALAALLGTASAVSMSQPGTASIQSASTNITVLAAGAEDAFVGNYTASVADIAACLPLSIKFYDAQRSGQVCFTPFKPLRCPFRPCVPASNWAPAKLAPGQHPQQMVCLCRCQPRMRVLPGGRTPASMTRSMVASMTQVLRPFGRQEGRTCFKCHHICSFPLPVDTFTDAI